MFDFASPVKATIYPPRSGPGAEPVHCTVLTRDLSCGGIGIAHTEQLFPKQIIVIDAVGKLLVGEVPSWCRREDDDFYVAGCRLVKTSVCVRHQSTVSKRIHHHRLIRLPVGVVTPEVTENKNRPSSFCKLRGIIDSPAIRVLLIREHKRLPGLTAVARPMRSRRSDVQHDTSRRAKAAPDGPNVRAGRGDSHQAANDRRCVARRLARHLLRRLRWIAPAKNTQQFPTGQLRA